MFILKTNLSPCCKDCPPSYKTYPYLRLKASYWCIILKEVEKLEQYLPLAQSLIYDDYLSSLIIYFDNIDY